MVQESRYGRHCLRTFVEQVPERPDHVFDPGVEVDHGPVYTDMHERLGCSFAEDHCRVQSHLRVWFLSRRGVGDHEHYPAVFQRVFREDQIGCIRSAAALTNGVDRGGVEDEVPMLVDYVEPMQLPEKVEIMATRVGVGLYRLDALESLGGNAAADGDGCWICDLAVHVVGYATCTYGELGGLARLPPVQLDQLPREVIECGPQVVDEVANDGGEGVGNRSGLQSPVDVLGAPVVHLGDETIETRFLPGPPLHVEDLIVIAGPGKFDFDAAEIGHAC